MDSVIFGLIGRKLGHSYSVPIHRQFGCDGYALYELEPDKLEGFLRRGDIGGLNVTIPYKLDVIPMCSELTRDAADIGSVNTIVRRADGTLLGHNTDAYGFEYMARRAGIDFCGKKVVIFGSGGASRTVRHVATTSGARKVVTVSRTGEDNYENLCRHADADILVNATPLGMYPNNGVSPADISGFPQCSGVLDLVYNPQHTALILQAEELGIPCSDGLPMLVAQAKAAEELFTGQSIPDREAERVLALMRRTVTNIVLIGMPGSGKSSIGQKLAEMTGRTLIDTDSEIERMTGRSIPEIFACEGESAFRRYERDAVVSAGRQSGAVIVTGGGCVTVRENRASLRQNGRVYHIIRDTSLLPREGRPLSQGADLDEMLRIRGPLYADFRDAVTENTASVADAAEAIWRDFCENTGDQRTQPEHAGHP